MTAIEEVKGGGGGGGGGINTVNDKHGPGGAGGGAVVLAAGVRIVVGTPTADAGASAGPPGINAGGCGGASGSDDDSTPRGGGAGGGAGGLIVLEAPEVTGSGNSGIAANGGGGGGGAYGGFGRDGAISTERTLGGENVFNEAPVCSDRGGKGGAGTTPTGTNGEVLSSACGTTNASRRGAGGGGSAGFIRVRTKPGSTATFGGGFIISPSVGDAYAAGALVVQ